MSGKKRLHDLGIRIGHLPPGPKNAITDVPGVLVGMTTLVSNSPSPVCTGVTAIYPRPDIHQDFVLAASHVFNGIGEMSGLIFVEETSMLTSPIMLTSTHSLGLVYDALIRYGMHKHGHFTFTLPVVGETFDGWLNDVHAFALREEHVVSALESAGDGAVQEGNSGGGTGMIAYDFKAGSGTASRVATIMDQTYTVGAFVQANHGDREHLMVNGVRAGLEIGKDVVPSPWPTAPGSSSILIIIGTDAPLLQNGCRRLAQRATIGLARTGGYGLDGSGDIFLAFSTGNHILRKSEGLQQFQCVPFNEMDGLILAASEAVEEAILNALVAAETLEGVDGHTAYALPHDQLVQVMGKGTE